MLFFLGGLVRTTGSGMGCPDWPKCFGSYIPPTSEKELPSDYKSIFLSKRLEKTERFAALLIKLGFEDKAQEIMMHDDLRKSHEFNVAKAYTEYINRLWGALTGLIVLLTLIASFIYFRTDLRIFIYTLLGFGAVIVNAILGAVVVNANLIPNIVTIHFLAAFASISFFLLARFRAKNLGLETIRSKNLKFLSILGLSLIIVQIILGSQVRETYDSLDLANKSAMEIGLALGTAFNIHRVIALFLVIVVALQYKKIKLFKSNSSIAKYSLYALIAIVVQIILGSMIVLGGLSSISKLFHITLGAALFVLQFYICGLIIRHPLKVKPLESN